MNKAIIFVGWIPFKGIGNAKFPLFFLSTLTINSVTYTKLSDTLDRSKSITEIKEAAEESPDHHLRVVLCSNQYVNQAHT